MSDRSKSLPRVWSVRRFGWQLEDLNIDFAREDRPGLVTQILSACLVDSEGVSPDDGHVWSLTVSQRIERLLQLAAMSGEFAGRLILHCPQIACRKSLEIELPVTEIFNMQREAQRQELLEWRRGLDVLRFRRPTGRDQLAWQSGSFPDLTQTRTAIVVSLFVSEDEAHRGYGNDIGLPSTELVDGVDEALGGFDPLVAFSVAVHCPHCGAAGDLAVDLEALALSELKRVQAESFQHIHRLAAAYHWSERQILDLTPERRGHYLKLIGEAS